MKYTKTLKGFEPSERFIKMEEAALARLNRLLTNFKEDVPNLTFLVKMHEKKHFYSAVVALTLPHKVLSVKGGGESAEGALTECFKGLEREYETYKGKHFKGYSKYPHRESLGNRKSAIN